MTDSSVHNPWVCGTGTSVGPRAEMIRCSRRMSCAEDSTCPSGGRRSTHRRSAVSFTANVRFEWPPAMRENPRGGVASGTCSANHAVTPDGSIPSGDLATSLCGDGVIVSVVAGSVVAVTVVNAGRADRSLPALHATSDRWEHRSDCIVGETTPACRGADTGRGASGDGDIYDWVMPDVTDATFQTQVIERSATVPVVVDLWADWCQPCKILGPVIEKVIAETNGAVELAKVDIEANPQVAQAFQAQSIPAVHAIVEGRVVDGFLGAQPEATVRAFVQKLVQTPEQARVAQLVAQGDEASLRAAVGIIADDPAAVVALAALLVERSGDGDAEEAAQLLERIPESAETRHLAALARAGGRPAGGDAEVSAELDLLLAQVKADDDARARFVDLLEVLEDDEARTAWRRKLSASLF